MIEVAIVRVISKTLIPFILLFALYVQFHGDFGPGGGFQAGVIFAAGFILYGLVFGIRALRRVVSQSILESLIAVGLLLYAITGVVCMIKGGNFLDYGALDHHSAIHGRHLGLLLIELGVGITVAAVMVTIFINFADRSSKQK
jgi:multicomponent Na+:H+ antiporter subunit B